MNKEFNKPDPKMMEQLKQMREKMDQENKPKPVEVKNIDELLSVPGEENLIAPTINEEISNIEDTDSQSKDYSDVENEAMLSGWLPKEQFKGNPKDYVDAKTFLDRGDFRLIEARKLRAELKDEAKKNEELRNLVKGLVDDIKNAEEKTRKRVLNELAQEKERAIQSDSYLAVKAIEQKEAEYNNKKLQDNNKTELMEAYKRACQKAPWLADAATDPVAKAKFDKAELALRNFIQAKPNATLDEQFDFAIEYINASYNNVEEIGRVPKGSQTISGSTISTKSGNKDKNKPLTVKDLTPNQLNNYNQLESDPNLGITGKQYLELLNKQLRG